MAHVGQELAFGVTGVLGGLLGLAQFLFSFFPLRHFSSQVIVRACQCYSSLMDFPLQVFI